MALLPDEQYVMISDSIEKKKIAHSSHNRKTHCGKGGRVKFPSDYLSKKELKAMNGDVKSYNLNRPMTWKEFRSMPKDLQAMYIKKLRNEFGVPDIVLSKAMGICKSSFSRAMSDLNLSLGKNAGAKNKQWFDSEKSFKFFNYWNKFNIEKTIEDDSVEDEAENVEDASVEEEIEAVEEMDISEETSNDYTTDDTIDVSEINYGVDELLHYGTKYISERYPSTTVDHVAESDHITIPTGGRLSFDCRFDDAIKVLESILSGTNVRLNVDWVVVKGD